MNYHFFNSLTKEEPVRSVLEILSKEGYTPRLVGGCVGNPLLLSLRPRDWDICIDDCHVCEDSKKIVLNELHRLFPMATINKTKMGGFELEIDNTQFDIWNLSESWWFQISKDRIFPNYNIFPDDMLAGALLNVDTLFTTPHKYYGHNINFSARKHLKIGLLKKEIREKTLRLNRKTYLEDEWFYHKILSTTDKYIKHGGWRMDDELKSYIENWRYDENAKII